MMISGETHIELLTGNAISGQFQYIVLIIGFYV